VDEDGPPPPELELAWQCQRWHCLPSSGALLDQDARTMYRMAALLNVNDALSHLRNCSGEQIHSLSDAERTILKVLIDNKLIFSE
jgi:hypothetical protein